MSQFSQKIHGTVVPMISPFTSAGELDEAAVARLVSRLAENQFGAFMLGTTGEAASIPPEMGKRLVEIAVNVADGRVPVFAGIGDNCVADTIRCARTFLDLGVTAVVAHLPAYYLLTPTEIEAFFRLLSAEINGPLIVYNIPATTHMSIPVEIVHALADDPHIIGFKDSEATDGRIEKIAPLARRSDFSIFMGAARLSVAALRAGYDGLVPSAGNLDQATWRQLAEHAAKGEWQLAEDCQTRLNKLATLYQTGRTLGQSLAALKSLMSVDGCCEPHVLPPLQPLTADQNRQLAESLAACQRDAMVP